MFSQIILHDVRFSEKRSKLHVARKKQKEKWLEIRIYVPIHLLLPFHLTKLFTHNTPSSTATAHIDPSHGAGEGVVGGLSRWRGRWWGYGDGAGQWRGEAGGIQGHPWTSRRRQAIHREPLQNPQQRHAATQAKVYYIYTISVCMHMLICMRASPSFQFVPFIFPSDFALLKCPNSVKCLYLCVRLSCIGVLRIGAVTTILLNYTVMKEFLNGILDSRKDLNGEFTCHSCYSGRIGLICMFDLILVL